MVDTAAEVVYTDIPLQAARGAGRGPQRGEVCTRRDKVWGDRHWEEV